MIKTYSLWDNLTWVAVSQPNQQDFSQLVENYHVLPRYISYIKDRRERARFNYDNAHDSKLLIFRVIPEHKDDHELGTDETLPVAFLLRENLVMTIVQNETKYVVDLMASIVKDHREQKRPVSELNLIIELLFNLNDGYADRIDALDDIQENLENYHRRPSNKQIAELTKLDKGLVYLKTAAHNNVLAIGQIQVLSDADDDPLHLDESETQHLKDLMVEVEQSRSLADISAEVVEKLSNNYSNVLDNSLNTTMRLLTVWTLALAFPPIVSGFWGMNMDLPLTKLPWAWVLSIVLSVVPIFALVWYLRKHHDL